MMESDLIKAWNDHWPIGSLVIWFTGGWFASGKQIRATTTSHAFVVEGFNNRTASVEICWVEPHPEIGAIQVGATVQLGDLLPVLADTSINEAASWVVNL